MSQSEVGTKIQSRGTGGGLPPVCCGMLSTPILADALGSLGPSTARLRYAFSRPWAFADKPRIPQDKAVDGPCGVRGSPTASRRSPSAWQVRRPIWESGGGCTLAVEHGRATTSRKTV